jgi:hypothetical protein
VPAWIAQLKLPPESTAVAVPETPLIWEGVYNWPSWFAPQQTTLPVPVWIAQSW